MQGIIVENIANLYQISPLLQDSNENAKNCSKDTFKKVIFKATARGKFKKEEISPVVGDIVEFEVTEQKSKQAVIDEILERKVYLKRPKLANITQIVFVVSSKNPKPDLLMLDKQLIYAEFLNIKPIIVINKIDLEKYKEIEEIYTKMRI